MRIADARLPAADPDTLESVVRDDVGTSPSFMAGVAAPHHFAFHVSDLEPWKERLDLSEEHDFSSWGGARAVYFRDPEENVVELITDRSPARADLAEVGLPVDDVSAAVEALADIGLTTYAKGTTPSPPSATTRGS